jgi:hypothetical protein
MPALQNPRHERYAQLIFEGLTNGESKPYSQSRAYLAAIAQFRERLEPIREVSIVLPLGARDRRVPTSLSLRNFGVLRSG